MNNHRFLPAKHYLIMAMLLVVGVIHLLRIVWRSRCERLAALYGLPLNEPNLAILMPHRAVLFSLLGQFMVYTASQPGLQTIGFLTGSCGSDRILCTCAAKCPQGDPAMHAHHPILRTAVAVSLSWVALCAHAAPSCSAQAMHSATYAQALEVVRLLPELTAWSRTHGLPVVFGESLDKQQRLEGRCYWSVSVYVNRPERLELWHTFYVESEGKRLLVQDPTSDSAISLQKWRSKGDKSRVA
jgi:hypothetical protein